MHSPLAGLHHVTAIAGDPRQNRAFYTGTLGLRLVKKTVNFDDPSAYHLYYGDATGTPGSIVTFFYWPGLAARGRVGAGQMTAIVFSAPAAALDFWQTRLAERAIAVKRATRFGETVLTFADPDGIPLEIVGAAADPRSGWSGGEVPAAHALRGLHSAPLTVRQPQATEDLLQREMGFQLVAREGNRARFSAGPAAPGRFADVIGDATAAGAGGSGTIHHLAWRVADDAAQRTLQERLHDAGLGVSPVRDRSYFRSIYYRERGGILFEIATDTPGFAIDESVDALGTGLKLPAPFEPHRRAIEAGLPSLEAAASST